MTTPTLTTQLWAIFADDMVLQHSDATSGPEFVWHSASGHVPRLVTFASEVDAIEHVCDFCVRPPADSDPLTQVLPRQLSASLS